jgi:hypothetical protein
LQNTLSLPWKIKQVVSYIIHNPRPPFIAKTKSSKARKSNLFQLQLLAVKFKRRQKIGKFQIDDDKTPHLENRCCIPTENPHKRMTLVSGRKNRYRAAEIFAGLKAGARQRMALAGTRKASGITKNDNHTVIEQKRPSIVGLKARISDLFALALSYTSMMVIPRTDISSPLRTSTD